MSVASGDGLRLAGSFSPDRRSARVKTGGVGMMFGREVPLPSLRPDVPIWQERLYAFMTRNAARAPDYFLIPASQVVELGTKVERKKSMAIQVEG